MVFPLLFFLFQMLARWYQALKENLGGEEHRYATGRFARHSVSVQLEQLICHAHVIEMPVYRSGSAATPFGWILV